MKRMNEWMESVLGEWHHSGSLWPVRGDDSSRSHPDVEVGSQQSTQLSLWPAAAVSSLLPCSWHITLYICRSIHSMVLLKFFSRGGGSLFLLSVLRKKRRCWVGGVTSPSQILQDAQSEELEVCVTLHHLPVDGQVWVRRSPRPLEWWFLGPLVEGSWLWWWRSYGSLTWWAGPLGFCIGVGFREGKLHYPSIAQSSWWLPLHLAHQLDWVPAKSWRLADRRTGLAPSGICGW